MLDFTYNPLKENIVVIGQAQSGKTTFGKKLALSLKDDFNILILDHHRKFTDLNPLCVKRTLFDIKGQGLEILQPFEITKEFFNDLCAVVYSLTNLVFIVDELHNFVTKYNSPKNLYLLAHNCNNRDIGYIGIFQAPAEIPSYVIRNAHHKFLFYMDLPTDVDYCKKWISHEVTKFVTGEIPKYNAIYKKGGQSAQVFAA